MTPGKLLTPFFIGLLFLAGSCSQSSSSNTSSADSGSTSSNVVIGVSSPPAGYASFSTLSGLQRGDELRLRLNREGTRIDEYPVYLDSIYNGGERLLLLTTEADLVVGAGDSGSPVLDAQGRVVASLCYGWADNKHFFAARAIEDLLALQGLPSARNAGRLAGLGLQKLGLVGPSVELRSTRNWLQARGGAWSFHLLDSFASRGERRSLRDSSLVLQPTLQPGNTIAVLDLDGDLTSLGAYGTLSYQSGSEWYAFGHSYTLSGGQLSKPVVPAEMVTMIDTSPVARKLPKRSAGSFGAMTADYFEGIRINPSATASTIEAIARITLDNQTDTFTHQVSLDVDASWQRGLLAYALSVPADYLLGGIIRRGSGSGVLTWTYDNASSDNTTVSVSSTDLTSQLFSSLESDLQPLTDNTSRYWSLSRLELDLSLQLD